MGTRRRIAICGVTACVGALLAGVASGCRPGCIYSQEDRLRDENAMLRRELAGVRGQILHYQGETLALMEENERFRDGRTPASRPASAPGLPEGWVPCEEGVKLTLETDLLFEPGTAQLKEGGLKACREAGAAILRLRGRPVRVYGFVDDSPMRGYRDEERLALSLLRAGAVSCVLRTAGIRGDDIETIGMGRFRPIAPADAGENRKNRRIEIVVVTDRER